MELKRKVFNLLLEEIPEPFVLVVESFEGVDVPSGYSNDGVIVLNMSVGATRGYSSDDYGISYSATFGGVHHDVHVPYAAILGVLPRGEPTEMYGLPLGEEVRVEVVQPEVVQPEVPRTGYAGWHKNATVV